MNFSNASRGITLAILLLVAGWASAFQIGPLGTQHEERLTNESNSTLARMAGALGVLIKTPVHEEITHLGKWCSVERGNLATDTYCSGRDVGYASPYVIYGVRWNDLPPFRLDKDQGNCDYMGRKNVCRADQTIRFSTQPACWYCLFKDAERKAQSKAIVGCNKTANSIPGNLMTRSHFGDLQFLHGMAHAADIHPVDTRAEILDWIEFAWKVSSREILPSTFLKDIDNPTMKRHFGCTEWKVVDLYLLGRQDSASGLVHQIREIAFGSVLHTVQDSFAAAHAEREPQVSPLHCEGSAFAMPSPIVEFHSYGAQDGALHDHDDSREAMTAATSERWPEAVEVTRNLFELQSDGAKWADASSYLQCVFTLSDRRRVSSPGETYRRMEKP
ncbi:MAG: hypothetical protein RR311_07375 [Comamonas sp.]